MLSPAAAPEAFIARLGGTLGPAAAPGVLYLETWDSLTCSVNGAAGGSFQCPCV